MYGVVVMDVCCDGVVVMDLCFDGVVVMARCVCICSEPSVCAISP